MKKWKFSRYSATIKCNSGDVLLHNSFMGAIARVPADTFKGIESFFHGEINEFDYLDNEFLKELCDGGFFVSTDIDEYASVSKTLYEEREKGFHIIILPHENCNFRCTYCYEAFERGKMNSSVVKGLKALVGREAKEGKDIVISWFGGEPLLAKDIIFDLSNSFLVSCKENGVRYTSNITSNGYFLTEDVASSLLQSGVRSFQITIDGVEDVHDSSRKLKGGGGTYRQIIDNLLQMSKRKEKFHVTIRVNFSDDFISSSEQFLEEISRLFAHDKRFALSFHPVGKLGGPNDKDLVVCDPDSVWLKSLKLAENGLNSGMMVDNLKDRLMPQGDVCYAGKESSIVIRSDGKICKCTVALDDPRNIVGKLNENGELLIDRFLWNMWTKVEGIDDGKCKSCSYSASCQSRACPLIAINEKIPPCPMVKPEYESLVKLVAFGKLIDIPIQPKLLSNRNSNYEQ
jgi:uncharacterized protein